MARRLLPLANNCVVPASSENSVIMLLTIVWLRTVTPLAVLSVPLTTPAVSAAITAEGRAITSLPTPVALVTSKL